MHNLCIDNKFNPEVKNCNLCFRRWCSTNQSTFFQWLKASNKNERTWRFESCKLNKINESQYPTKISSKTRSKTLPITRKIEAISQSIKKNIKESQVNSNILLFISTLTHIGHVCFFYSKHEKSNMCLCSMEALSRKIFLHVSSKRLVLNKLFRIKMCFLSGWFSIWSSTHIEMKNTLELYKVL